MSGLAKVLSEAVSLAQAPADLGTAETLLSFLSPPFWREHVYIEGNRRQKQEKDNSSIYSLKSSCPLSENATNGFSVTHTSRDDTLRGD